MKAKWSYSALLVLIFVSGTAAANNEIIKLTTPSDIHDAMLVSQAMEPVTKKVMNCVKHKLAAPQKCFCLYPDAVQKLQAIYDKTIQKHPNWKDNVVSYTDPQKKFGDSLNFYALRLQFEKKCQ